MLLLGNVKLFVRMDSVMIMIHKYVFQVGVDQLGLIKHIVDLMHEKVCDVYHIMLIRNQTEVLGYVGKFTDKKKQKTKKNVLSK